MDTQDTVPQQLEIAPPIPQAITVNSHCHIEESDGVRVVSVLGFPIYRYPTGDRIAEALFIAQAIEVGYATPAELTRVVHPSHRTIYRIHERYEREGAIGLIQVNRGGRPRGQTLGKAREMMIRQWHAEGITGREMARRLGVAVGVVQKAMRRMGLRPQPRGRPRQEPLPIQRVADSGEATAEVESEPAPGVDETPAEPEGEPVPVAGEASAERVSLSPSLSVPAGKSSPGMVVDPFNRSLDRLLASQGLLFDAEPVFAPGRDIPRLGVLLAIPLIVATGLLDEAKALYGTLGPAFYGLRTSLLTMVLLALLRIRHPENLKEYSPPDLGRLLGLDRAPEVKTLRRKLLLLAEGPSDELMIRLVKRRIGARDDALGFLYVDGHVRVYSGKARLPKTHVARMRISLPATQDVWVNDADGDPLFFVTEEAHPSLVKSLEDLLPVIRDQVGDDRRVTVVFDRGGWSPKLFGKMVAAGFDVLTYRKGGDIEVPVDWFEPYEAPDSHGRKTWDLHQMSTWVGSKKDGLWMRQVTRLKGDHQTQIMTTRHDLDLTEVAHRMFNRWRQENYFKYMRQEFAIDALVQYGEEQADPDREIPNPAWTAADKKLKKAKKKLRRLEADYGAAAADNPEKQRPTMRGFKIAHGKELGVPMREQRQRVEQLQQDRDALPKRTTAGQLPADQRPVRLPQRRKRLSDGLKMLAYQVESDLVRAIAPHYRRVDDEGRTLIAAAMRSGGDIDVTEEELRVTLAPQSSPHRSRVIAELCRALDQTETRFPGTDLRMRFGVRGVDPGADCAN
ncbi:hypothetical protein H8E07_19135 [bacterium]|nr:hypothetical protein [bacterium]